MFKIVALLGVLTGGAGYAVYEYTDLFGTKHTCPLSGQSCAVPQPISATPSCCVPSEACCEEVAPCCESVSRAVALTKPACCAEACCEAKATTLAAKLAQSCDNPHFASALLAVDACAGRVTCCDASSATAAVAGAAAMVPVK